MKRTDLEKLQGKQLTGQMKNAGSPNRFGKDSSTPIDKREQRRRDAEAGLIPFATKLPTALVQRLREKSEADGVSLSEMLAELLVAALDAPAKTKKKS
ncbi:MAG: hypothetical protein JNJ55_05660 [Betaproteobacteria bacterium]|nr:hypothetical protein [Betaproteobacteria bacterium]